MHLALIKARQHSPRPTALFTLVGEERARMAFANLVAGPICPQSIAAFGERGRMGKGSQRRDSFLTWGCFGCLAL